MQKNVKESVLRYFRGARPGRILDIPSGNGWLSKELVPSGWEYFGADLFSTPSVKGFTKADLNEELPFKDGEFDYAACLEGLEHIENHHHALKEFSRILKRGGVLIISTPNPLNIKSRIRFLLTGTFYGFPHLVRLGAEGGHVHMTPVNLSFLVTFAGRYGLELDRVHRVRIRPGMYRFIIQPLVLKLYSFMKNLRKTTEEKVFKRRFTSLNVLLNDGLVVSFRKVLETDRRSARAERAEGGVRL